MSSRTSAIPLASLSVEEDLAMPSVYDLLRQRCGLSQKQAADFHDARVDTVVSWCSDRRKAPQGVIDELLDLYDDITESALELSYLVQLTPQVDDAGDRFIRIGLPQDDDDAVVCGFPCASACEAAVALAITHLKRNIPVRLVPRVRGAIPTAVTQKKGQRRITVYNFKVWDAQSGDYVMPKRKSPRERIRSIGGEVITETAERIDPNDLDDHGRYDPSLTEDGTAADGLRLVYDLLSPWAVSGKDAFPRSQFMDDQVARQKADEILSALKNANLLRSG
jgi:hypothetical protein